jgi:hypothetical protein
MKNGTWRWLFTSSFVRLSTFINSRICLGVATVTCHKTLSGSNSHRSIRLVKKIRHFLQFLAESCQGEALYKPWEPPSCWRALTNRRWSSGDQHLHFSPQHHLCLVEGAAANHFNTPSNELIDLFRTKMGMENEQSKCQVWQFKTSPSSLPLLLADTSSGLSWLVCWHSGIGTMIFSTLNVYIHVKTRYLAILTCGTNCWCDSQLRRCIWNCFGWLW